jgi:hypothetical protein
MLLIGWRSFFPEMHLALVVESLAAAVVVYDVYYREFGPIQWFCNLKFIQYLGKISYSLYVNALICTFLSGVALVAFFSEKFIAAHGLAFNVLGCIITFWLDVALSTLTYKYIEHAFMSLGKFASIRISGSLLEIVSGLGITSEPRPVTVDAGGQSQTGNKRGLREAPMSKDAANETVVAAQGTRFVDTQQFSGGESWLGSTETRRRG